MHKHNISFTKYPGDSKQISSAFTLMAYLAHDIPCKTKTLVDMLIRLKPSFLVEGDVNLQTAITQ